MAKYRTSLRNERMTSVLTAIRGGTMVLCSGAVPSTLGAPASGVRLSEHAIGGSAGSVASGVLTLSDADAGQDTAANNSGTPTYAIFLDAANDAVAQYAIPSQMTLSINGGASTAITAGNPTDVDSVTITEGNP